MELSSYNNTPNNKNSIDYVLLLTCSFIVLRVANVIDWPWYKVLIPIWAAIIVLLIIGLIKLIAMYWWNR